MEAPSLEKAYLAFKDRNVYFFSVFVTSKEKDIREFVETFNLTLPVGKDTGIAEALDVKAIPETVFIDRDGQIIERHRDTITYDELVTGIEKLL